MESASASHYTPPHCCTRRRGFGLIDSLSLPIPASALRLISESVHVCRHGLSASSCIGLRSLRSELSFSESPLACTFTKMSIQLNDINWPFLAPAIALGLFLAWHLLSQWSNLSTSRTNASTNDPYQDIEPLDFQDWTAIEPMKIRPFRPKFYLTMGKTRIQFDVRSALTQTNSLQASRIARCRST